MGYFQNGKQLWVTFKERRMIVGNFDPGTVTLVELLDMTFNFIVEIMVEEPPKNPLFHYCVPDFTPRFSLTCDQDLINALKLWWDVEYFHLYLSESENKTYLSPLSETLNQYMNVEPLAMKYPSPSPQPEVVDMDEEAEDEESEGMVRNLRETKNMYVVEEADDEESESEEEEDEESDMYEVLREHFNESSNEPSLSEVMNQSSNQPLNEPMSQCSNEPLNEPMSQCSNQPLSDPMSQCSNQPFSEPLSQCSKPMSYMSLLLSQLSSTDPPLMHQSEPIIHEPEPIIHESDPPTVDPTTTPNTTPDQNEGGGQPEINLNVEEEEDGGWNDWVSDSSDDSDYAQEVDDIVDSDVSLEREDINTMNDTIISSDEDNSVHDANQNMYRGRMWELESDGTIKLQQWDMFIKKQKFNEVLRDYCVQEGKYLKQIKHARYRYTGKCHHAQCTWRIHASLLQDGRTFQIKTLKGVHDWTCPHLIDNPAANSSWVARKLLPQFKKDPTWKVKDLYNELEERYGLQLKAHVLRRGRDLLIHAVEGRHDTSYQKLASYCEMVKVSNPGSHAYILWDKPLTPTDSPRFKRLFISLAGCIEGFKKGCRSFIGVDGCHLKGPYRGVLLTAIGLNGDNHCFPLAYAIVESENNESWGYFFTALVHLIGIEEHKWYTVISDRCKGVMNACSRFFPDASRRVCLVHLERNMKRKFGTPELVQLMWGAANSYTRVEHQRYMDELRSVSEEAYLWLMREPVNHWCRYTYLPHTTVPDNTSNFVESFNNVVGDLRDKPVLVLLEGIRKQIVKWMVERKKEEAKWTGKVVPMVMEKVKCLIKEGNTCKVLHNGDVEADVEDRTDMINYTLNLATKTCDCGRWSVSGIPCKHAIKCLMSLEGHTIEDYVSEYYYVDKVRSAYSPVLHPIKDICMWPNFGHPDLLPPNVVTVKGRRPRNRRRGSEEARKKGSRHTSVRCKTCKALHHNSLTCPMNVRVPKSPKRKSPYGKQRGRPTLAQVKARAEAEAQGSAEAQGGGGQSVVGTEAQQVSQTQSRTGQSGVGTMAEAEAQQGTQSIMTQADDGEGHGFSDEELLLEMDREIEQQRRSMLRFPITEPLTGFFTSKKKKHVSNKASTSSSAPVKKKKKKSAARKWF